MENKQNILSSDISNEDTEISSDNPVQKKRKRKWTAVLSVVLIALASSAAVFMAVFFSITTEKIVLELGDKPNIESIYKNKLLSSLYSVESCDIDLTKVGSSFAELKFFGFIPGKAEIEIRDTTPPEIKLTDIHSVAGIEITTEDFVVSCSDKSDITLSSDDINFDTVGEYTLSFTAADLYGNKTVGEALFTVCDKSHVLDVELGTSDIENALREKLPDITRIDMKDMPLDKEGEYVFYAFSDTTKYIWLANVRDTLPPSVKTKPLALRIGEEVTPEKFIVSVSDSSEYTSAFTSVKSTSSEKSAIAFIDIEDIHGNLTSAVEYMLVSNIPESLEFEYGTTLDKIKKKVLSQTSYSKNFTLSDIPTDVGNYSMTATYGNFGYEIKITIADTKPPVIYGATNKTISAGESVSFKSGVSAKDAHDGDVEIKVDSSKINTQVSGRYPVVYSATDSSGNTANVTVYLTVGSSTMQTVNSLADKIMAKIITNNMTPKQKAEAIYNWVTKTFSYSTRTSYLMGNFTEAAYSGFNIRSGNCYIYYAVSSVLLSKAGIENIEIKRNDPTNPHYWNLVNIDGNWYHFDACPHPKGHFLRSFLLTDKEVKAYSDNHVKDYYSFDASLYPATP